MTFLLRLLLFLLDNYSPLLSLHEVFIPIVIQVSILVPLFDPYEKEDQKKKDPVLKKDVNKDPSAYI